MAGDYLPGDYTDFDKIFYPQMPKVEKPVIKRLSLSEWAINKIWKVLRMNEKLAMEAYYKFNGNFPTEEFPLWIDLPEKMKEAWISVVKEIRDNL